jgi:hypothetical protein
MTESLFYLYSKYSRQCAEWHPVVESIAKSMPITFIDIDDAKTRSMLQQTQIKTVPAAIAKTAQKIAIMEGPQFQDFMYRITTMIQQSQQAPPLSSEQTNLFPSYAPPLQSPQQPQALQQPPQAPQQAVYQQPLLAPQPPVYQPPAPVPVAMSIVNPDTVVPQETAHAFTDSVNTRLQNPQMNITSPTLPEAATSPQSQVAGIVHTTAGGQTASQLAQQLARQYEETTKAAFDPNVALPAQNGFSNMNGVSVLDDTIFQPRGNTFSTEGAYTMDQINRSSQSGLRGSGLNDDGESRVKSSARMQVQQREEIDRAMLPPQMQGNGRY